MLLSHSRPLTDSPHVYFYPGNSKHIRPSPSQAASLVNKFLSWVVKSRIDFKKHGLGILGAQGISSSASAFTTHTLKSALCRTEYTSLEMSDRYRPPLFCTSPRKGVDPSAIHLNFNFLTMLTIHTFDLKSPYSRVFPGNASNLDSRKFRLLVKAVRLQHTHASAFGISSASPCCIDCFIRGTTSSPNL